LVKKLYNCERGCIGYNPPVKSNRGYQFKIGLGDQFYIGWAHQYIRTKGTCIGDPGQYEISGGDPYYIGRCENSFGMGWQSLRGK
jgi:hypothetical protein